MADTSDTSTVTSVWTHDVTDTTNGTTVTHSTLTQHVHGNLLWLIPVIFGMIFFLLGLAWCLFYAFKKCKIATVAFCYRKFGLCPPDKRSKMLYNTLEEGNHDVDSDTLYLRGKVFTVAMQDDNRFPGTKFTPTGRHSYSALSPTSLVLDGRELKPPPYQAVQ